MSSDLKAIKERLERDIFEYICNVIKKEEKFNELVIRKFSLQYEEDHAYREYCFARGINPDSIKIWVEIPPVIIHLKPNSQPNYRILPPWTRAIAVGARTGNRLPLGEIGLLKYYDLKSEKVVVQSNYYGYETDTGFEITGFSHNNGNFVSCHVRCGLDDESNHVHGSPCSTVADRMILYASEAHGMPCSTVADGMIKGL